MTEQEALQILGVTDETQWEEIVKHAKSGSFSPSIQSSLGQATKECLEAVHRDKIIKLGAIRISGMVERLKLSQQIRDDVYCLFQQILNQRTSLFFSCHIDQIILCCFYGVSKISQLNLTFKEILYKYRKQPQSKPFDENILDKLKHMDTTMEICQGYSALVFLFFHLYYVIKNNHITFVQ